jgi:iron complex transport system substrate-binding protein
MRIVSLLPAATEIVFALGLGDELVGRSHLCDTPDEASDVTPVTSADDGGLDIALLVRLEPDLVIAPGTGRLRTPGAQEVRDLFRTRDLETSVLALEPRSLEGIFNGIASVGAFAEAEDEAVGLVELCRERLGELENGILERRLEGIASRRVVILESIDPPMQSGRWLPELVRRAGGWELLGREGEEPTPTAWEQVRDVEPEIIVLALAEGTAPSSGADLRRAGLPPWFDDLAAVREGELFAVDGAGLLLRPGPRIVEGVALLAELFDPEGFAGAGPEGAWIPLGPLGIGSA